MEAVLIRGQAEVPDFATRAQHHVVFLAFVVVFLTSGVVILILILIRAQVLEPWTVPFLLRRRKHLIIVLALNSTWTMTFVLQLEAILAEARLLRPEGGCPPFAYALQLELESPPESAY